MTADSKAACQWNRFYFLCTVLFKIVPEVMLILLLNMILFPSWRKIQPERIRPKAKGSFRSLSGAGILKEQSKQSKSSTDHYTS